MESKHQKPPHKWRIPYPSLDATQSQYVIEGSMLHEITTILRMNVGDHFSLTDGSGRIANVELSKVEKKRCELKVTDIVEMRKPPWRLRVVLGTLRPTGLDEAISILSEMGVTEVILKKMDKSHGGQPVRWERLEKLTWEALRVNKWPWRTKISRIETFDDFPHEDNALHIICDESGLEQPSLKKHKSLVELLNQFPHEQLTFFIGPESGFSLHEVEAISSRYQAHSIQLGNRILRAPIAALTAAAIGLNFLER